MPAPPLRPVVSRSMKIVRRPTPPPPAPASGRDVRPGFEHAQAAQIADLAFANPHVAVPAIGFVASIDDQALAEVVAAARPPRISPTRSIVGPASYAADVGLVGQLAAWPRRRLRRLRSSGSTMARSLDVRSTSEAVVLELHRRWIAIRQRHAWEQEEQIVEDPQRDGLGVRAGVAFGPDARRAARFARAAGDRARACARAAARASRRAAG